MAEGHAGGQGGLPILSHQSLPEGLLRWFSSLPSSRFSPSSPGSTSKFDYSRGPVPPHFHRGTQCLPAKQTTQHPRESR